MRRRADQGTWRGTKAALEQAFPPPPPEIHLGAHAAEADFAALRAQLNDPPPQYADKNL